MLPSVLYINTSVTTILHLPDSTTCRVATLLYLLVVIVVIRYCYDPQMIVSMVILLVTRVTATRGKMDDSFSDSTYL